MSLERLVAILEAHGIGGQDMRALADDVLGERNPDSGLRPSDFPTKRAAKQGLDVSPAEQAANEQTVASGSETAGAPSGGGGAAQSGGAKSGQAGSTTGAGSSSGKSK